MKLQQLLDSGFVGPSVKVLGGSGKGFLWDPSMKPADAYDILEKAKQDVSRLTGKRVWCVIKCASGSREFLFHTYENTPSEIIDLGEGYSEIRFDEGFSIYGKYNPCHLGTSIFLDCREVVFPLKKQVSYGTARAYVFSVMGEYSFFYYLLPTLKYPKGVVSFIKWAKKKGKINYEKGEITLWNKDSDLTDSSDPSKYDLIEWRWIQEYVGAPIRNIKAEPDLDEYNIWLQDVVVPSLDSTKKTTTKSIFTSREIRNLHCPSKIYVTKLGITQADVDEYVDEINKTGLKISW